MTDRVAEPSPGSRKAAYNNEAREGGVRRARRGRRGAGPLEVGEHVGEDCGAGAESSGVDVGDGGEAKEVAASCGLDPLNDEERFEEEKKRQRAEPGLPARDTLLSFPITRSPRSQAPHLPFSLVDQRCIYCLWEVGGVRR